MNKKFTIIPALFIIIAGIACAQDSRDFQLWNILTVQGRINESYDFRVSSKTQYVVNEQQRDVTYLDLGVFRKMNSWLRLGAAFRASQLVRANGNIMEYRPQLVSTVQLSAQKIKYQTTNRLEHRSFSEGNPHFRYYHNIFIHFPPFAKLPKFYAGEELFTKLTAENTHLARIYGGLHVFENEYFGVDVYYVWQQSKVNKAWYGTDVLGFNLTYKLKAKNGMPHSPGS